GCCAEVIATLCASPAPGPFVAAADPPALKLQECKKSAGDTCDQGQEVQPPAHMTRERHQYHDPEAGKVDPYRGRLAAHRRNCTTTSCSGGYERPPQPPAAEVLALLFATATGVIMMACDG